MNNDNLIKSADLPEEERKKRASAAGIASGKARKAAKLERQAIRKVIQQVINGEFTDKDGEQLSGVELIAKRMTEIINDTQHKDWFRVVELIMRVTESDKSEEELEIEALEQELAIMQKKQAILEEAEQQVIYKVLRDIEV